MYVRQTAGEGLGGELRDEKGEVLGLMAVEAERKGNITDLVVKEPVNVRDVDRGARVGRRQMRDCGKANDGPQAALVVFLRHDEKKREKPRPTSELPSNSQDPAPLPSASVAPPPGVRVPVRRSATTSAPRCHRTTASSTGR